MRLITIIADGAHVRSEPVGIGDTPKNWFDKLAKGDQLEWLRTSEDGQWHQGRVSYIGSGKYLESRIGRIGWVHKDGVRVNPVSQPQPIPKAPHYGIWLLVAAAIALIAWFGLWQ